MLCFTGCNTWECLGNRVELALVAWVSVSQSQEHESRRSRHLPLAGFSIG